MGPINSHPSWLPRAAWVRGHALAQLWLHRSCWQLPLPRALMRRERDTQLADLMPAMLVIALMVGVLMFVTLPSTLGGSYSAALATLWPIWVIQAAPMAAAQVLAMQRAPTLALELSQRHASGEFEALALMQTSPAAYPCVPLLAAHAAVTAAAGFLLITLTLLIGISAAFVMAVGDLGQSIDAVFTLVSPLDWFRSLVTAMVLGLACSLATMLYAWPGTQTGRAGVDAHRLGLHAMIVSSLTTIAAALTLNWVLGVASFLKWW